MGPDAVEGTPEQLSGVAVVIIIAVGVQTFIMLFIFAKRQIMRFTLRSRRGPHVSVGQGGVKAFRREIDRRLDYASHIKYEPVLSRPGQADSLPHHYRLLAVDKVSELDLVITKYDSDLCRPAGANVRAFLTECLAGPLVGTDPRQIHNLCDLLDHARHNYKPFGQMELNNLLNILAELKTIVTRNTETRPERRKKTPTPVSNKPVNRPRKRRVDSRDPGAAVRFAMEISESNAACVGGGRRSGWWRSQDDHTERLLGSPGDHRPDWSQ